MCSSEICTAVKEQLVSVSLRRFINLRSARHARKAKEEKIVDLF